MEKNEKDFVKNLKILCNKHNIKFLKSKKQYLDEDKGMRCSGYFDEVNKILAVATGKAFSVWFPVLVHESCHLDQWLEKRFVKIESYKGKDISELSELWINGEIELSKKDIKIVFSRIRNIELDCEKRTIKKIKELNLNIDTDKYIRQANSYIYFHNMVMDTRKWYAASPFRYKQQWSVFPNHFNNNYGSLKPVYKQVFKKVI